MLGIIMTMQQIPNVRVWLQGREYIESAEILLDCNRVQPAAVLSALAIEIFVKSFFATRHASGHATTDHGHDVVSMFSRIDSQLQAELLTCSREVNSQIDLMAELRKHDGIFVSARYWYEPTATRVLGSDVVYFSRHLCETVFLLGSKRGV
jgi:HEPN domain-containing protein